MQVWYKKFGYVKNAQIIRASKLLTDMGKFGMTYDPAKIYIDFEVSKPDNVDAKPKSNAILQISKITNSESDFNEICKLCIENK